MTDPAAEPPDDLSQATADLADAAAKLSNVRDTLTQLQQTNADLTTQVEQLTAELQAAQGGGDTPQPPSLDYGLSFSTSPDRISPQPLDGQTVPSDVYVQALPTDHVAKVDFWIDAPTTDAPLRTEQTAPFDFAGGQVVNGQDLAVSAKLDAGAHVIYARFTLADGTTTDVQASFTVAAAATPPPPATGSGGSDTPPPAAQTWGILGNKGTRWISGTPGFAERVPDFIEVDPNYPAVTDAIAALVARGAKRAKVVVRPGKMSGYGSGSTAKPSIHDVGVPGDTRILVQPRDGYGTVDLGNARVFRVHGVSWAGFTAGGFRIDSCIDAGEAWINASGTLWWSTTAGEPPMTGLEVVDVCQLSDAVTDSDVTDCWPNGANIESPLFWGLLLTPHWRVVGSKAHQDTLQFEPFGGATVNNAVLRDCAIFGSKNAAIQVNGLIDPLIDHSYIMAQGYCKGRFPQPDGTESGSSWALNGGKYTPRIKARDSVIVGGWTISASTGVDSDIVAEVTNVITDTDRSAKYPGTYKVFPGLNDDNFEQMTGLARPLLPEVDFRLADVWK